MTWMGHIRWSAVMFYTGGHVVKAETLPLIGSAGPLAFLLQRVTLRETVR